MICILTLASCVDGNNKDSKNDLKGEFFYSQDKNVSYYFPEGFTPFISENEKDYNRIVSNMSNPKLKHLLSGNYIEGHILPIAEGFEYLYKEDIEKYQSVFLNEVKHFRLNDASAEILASSNRMAVNKTNKDSTNQLNIYRDYFINKSDYQMIVNKGDFIINNDTVFWEKYLVSKFYRTFLIQVESNSEFDFLPYINKIQFGDKR